MSPTISIIVPVYNAEAYLQKCVDSILAQSYTDYELLLIDDGSKDSSPALCDQYAETDPRIIVIHKPNGGVSTARNMGLNRARGEWVTFVDADDWLDEGYLEIPSRYADFDLIVCQHKEFFLDGHIVTVDFPEQEEVRDNVIAGLSPHLREFAFMAPWAKFFRREILSQYRLKFDERLSFSEDNVFNFKYYEHARNFICVKDSYYDYRALGVPAFRKYGVKPETIIVILEELFGVFFRVGFDNPRFERMFLWHYTMWENCFFLQGTEEDRLKYYRHPLLLRLKADALSLFRPWDRVMFRICEHRSNALLQQIKKLYFKLRLGKEIKL